jgi:ligand-binding sensor domain-containing protein
MKRFYPLAFLAMMLIPYSSSSQTYGYTHYDVTDGLAGSTVYCITQDKDGFIWVGTESGVSRFDGTHFKNFTTDDGLPDVEVLKMFTDSKGRVWMAPFYRSVCYYFQGRIHNQENDSILHRIRLKGNVAHFAEDSSGNILIQERAALHLLFRNGRLKEYDSTGGRPLSNIETVSGSPSGHFLMLANDTLFELTGDNFQPLLSHAFWPEVSNGKVISPQMLIAIDSSGRYMIQSLPTGKTKQLAPSGWPLISLDLIADSLIYINESTGATEYNLLSGGYRRFLPGLEVSCTFRDADGNTWFSTLGHGLYRLNSDEFKSISLKAPGLADCAAYYIRRAGNDLYVGSNRHYFFMYRLPDLDHADRRRNGDDFSAHITYLEKIADGVILYTSDQDIGISNPGYSPGEQLHFGVKAAVSKSRNELLIANSNGGFTLRLQPLGIVDTFWRGRCTTLYYRGDTIFIGTLNGLYLLLKDRSVVFAGEKIPFLRKRIAAIAGAADGAIWVAAYDGGVMGYRAGKVIATITHSQGLTSDICRTLTIRNNTLWVGTNRGLNRIDLGDPAYRVTRYTAYDGLGSDIINTVYADSATVYVGTAAGFSFFEEHVHPSENCRLVLLSMVSGNRDRISDTAHLVLPYTSNNISFNYAGISYRSAGNITYRVRLMGLDTSWGKQRNPFWTIPAFHRVTMNGS